MKKGRVFFMKRFRKNNSIGQKIFSLMLIMAMVVSTVFTSVPYTAKAATNITSMNYYSGNDGPVISHSDAKEASYGFVMPIFNGGAATFTDVADDLLVSIQVNGAWQDIDTVSILLHHVPDPPDLSFDPAQPV